jgi:hypothetical protein
MEELGTFTTATRPTLAAVTTLIAQASQDVFARVGDDIPAAAEGIAKQCIVFRTAMLIELSYFPEQVHADRSPYAQYEKLYKDQVTILCTAVDELDDGGEIGDESDPQYDFPTAFGWDTTRW